MLTQKHPDTVRNLPPDLVRHVEKRIANGELPDLILACMARSIQRRTKKPAAQSELFRALEAYLGRRVWE